MADRAYLDFEWLHQLQQRGVTFVTRLKRNVRYQVLREHDVDIRTGVMSDQTIELTGARGRKAYPGTLRRVGYSGGSGTRNPEEVEQRFRRKWNSESGKWNTESGGSGTSIPEEVEQRFRRS